MILYYTTVDEQVDASTVECPAKVCRLKGVDFDHLCMSVEPVQGLGPNVFMADIPANIVSAFEYVNDFRVEETKTYSIPRGLLKEYPLVKDTYESVTGHEWNEWVIPVLDRRREGRKIGEWAVIWISRVGVASARVDEKSDDFLSLRVRTTVDFDPTTDYIVIERHEESERKVGPPIKETWTLKVLAGMAPQWTLFPSAWKNWVEDKEVEGSAVRYILHHCPEVDESVKFALERDTKANRARAWTMVATDLNGYLSKKYDTTIHLGEIRSNSWTAVMAMPHRIAGRLSQQLPYDPWKPPRPQPVYANPETSGRVVLANLYGPYPKEGPGVDHRPQDRAIFGIEGELDVEKQHNARSHRVNGQ